MSSGASGPGDVSRTFLPLRDKGLGFQSVRLTSAAALAASWHESLPLVRSKLDLHGIVQLECQNPIARRLMPEKTAHIRKAMDDQTLSLGDEGLKLSQNILAVASLTAASQAIQEQAAADLPHSAVLRSTSGPGAGAWLQAPEYPCQRMLDIHFALALRVRLHCEIPMMAGVCRHRRPDGSICRALLDTKGVHAGSCAVGGWLVRRHNSGVNVLGEWAAEECGCNIFKEQMLPSANEVHKESRLDLVIHSPNVAGPMYVDFTVASALSREALSKGSGVKDEVAASLAAKRKIQKYPGCTVYPFPVEDHGRLGEASLTLVKLLAPVAPQHRSQAISKLYRKLGAFLQRASADAMIAAAT